MSSTNQQQSQLQQGKTLDLEKDYQLHPPDELQWFLENTQTLLEVCTSSHAKQEWQQHPLPSQIPAVKEPICLMWQDGKPPDGTIILPWSKGRPLASDVTVPVTYADAHMVNTARDAGAAANHAATNKNTKYSQLSNTIVFVPVAIYTGGTWHHQAVELVQEIGRWTANITGDVRESTFLFQQLSVALQRGNASHFKTGSQPASSLQSVVSFS